MMKGRENVSGLSAMWQGAYWECECLMAALNKFLSVSDFVSSGSLFLIQVFVCPSVHQGKCFLLVSVFNRWELECLLFFCDAVCFVCCGY